MIRPVIRKAVPVPAARYRSPASFKRLLGHLMVGDSFVVPASEHYSVYTAAQRQTALTGERFSIIRLSKREVGVWRVA